MKETMVFLLLMSLLSVSCNKTNDDKCNQTISTSAETSQDSSCNTNTNTTSNTDTLDPTDSTTDTTPLPVVVPTPDSSVPELALTFKTNIELLNFNETQASKYNKAIQIVKLVVGTEEFKNQVLNYTYNGSKQFVDNKGLSNQEIYQTILEAAEKLRPIKNNTMDLEVELYYTNNSVVGYTNGGTTQIWVNTKFFDQYAPNSVAGNLFHEWLHKLGYTHDYYATAQRPHSVPYAIGYIIGNIGKKFL
ncbi:MAG: hypothetical protein AB7I27_15845 [Bacteriovoracaceae bacterium]